MGDERSHDRLILARRHLFSITSKPIVPQASLSIEGVRLKEAIFFMAAPNPPDSY
jgi:hypothetical protein